MHSRPTRWRQRQRQPLGMVSARPERDGQTDVRTDRQTDTCGGEAKPGEGARIGGPRVGRRVWGVAGGREEGRGRLGLGRRRCWRLQIETGRARRAQETEDGLGSAGRGGLGQGRCGEPLEGICGMEDSGARGLVLRWILPAHPGLDLSSFASSPQNRPAAPPRALAPRALAHSVLTSGCDPGRRGRPGPTGSGVRPPVGDRSQSPKLRKWGSRTPQVSAPAPRALSGLLPASPARLPGCLLPA